MTKRKKPYNPFDFGKLPTFRLPKATSFKMPASPSLRIQKIPHVRMPNIGFKIPRTTDPFKEIRSVSRNVDRQYNIKIPKISFPKITYPKPQPISRKLLTRTATRPISRPLVPKTYTQTSIFNPRPAESILPRRASDTIFNERRVGRPAVRQAIVQHYVIQRPVQPVIDIPKIVEKLLEKRRAQYQRPSQQNTMPLIEKLRRLNELSQRPLEQENSKIHEELAQNKKEKEELKEELSNTQEKITRLEKEMNDYKQMLIEAIKKSPSNPEDDPTTTKLLDIVTSLFTQIESLRDEVSQYKKYERDWEHLHRNNEDSAKDVAND